ncbi:MAG: hypothetical protein ACR2JD_06675 [Nocardioides sp.]
MRTRLALGALGTALGLYGAFLMLSRQQLDDWVEVGTWFVAGVVLHDFVLAPLVLLAGVVLLRILPAAARPASVVGLIVLGSVTLLAIPVLGGFGVKADNPTLFDRNYLAGWLVLAVVVGIGVGVGSWLHVRRTAESGGAGDGARARR